ncbi:phage tail assembly chaperone [Pseudomonas oryziphila]|uniref:Phage tail assembly chaperone-like domain-containing protein n=1 Tax=Pseudomonas entomophila TaxID=312306 RepID=A0A3Q8TZY8_9PSED|nr:phage tail assembly chaperone [Pseudomonas oryziphila]AZL67953.1 hypothetical protein EJA05_09435 [Pseudomonas oryziphila]
MPYVQRNEAGVIVGQFANRQQGYAEEWLADGSPELSVVGVEQQAITERAWRDAELAELIWLRDRHRDQLEIGAVTALTAEQFGELLVYMQQLRDWPQTPEFPDASVRPVVPPWIAEQTP